MRFPCGPAGKEFTCKETWVWSQGWEDPLEMGMVTHSSILAWRIPWIFQGFHDSSVGKESTCNAGDPSSTPWLGWSAGEGIGYPLQYSWASLMGSAGKESACNTRDLGSIPGLGRSPGEGKGYILQCSGLENSIDCLLSLICLTINAY